MHIVVVCGTNRRGALSRKLSRWMVSRYERLADSVDLLSMDELPQETLSPEAYQDKPPGTQALVDRFLRSDGVAFVVPEYNGSYPGVLKLFIDMLPFPEGFESRPCAFVGLAAGQFRGLRAVEHFQQVAGYRNAHLFPRRVFIGESFTQFDEDSGLKQADIADRLSDQAEGFCQFVRAIRA